MDKDLARLKASVDAARKRLDALSGDHIDETVEALRRQLVDLEHRERRTFSLNGEGDPVEAMRVTSEKMVVAERLRSASASKTGVNAQREAAGREHEAAVAELRKVLTRRHRGRLESWSGQAVKVIEGLLKGLDGLEAERLGDRQDYGATPEALETGLRDALNGIWTGLGQKRWRTPAERLAAEMERMDAEDRSRAEAKKSYAAEERKASKLPKEEKEKVLAVARERLGL